MPLDDILALCIGVPALIALIVLLYIMCIKSINTEKEYKKIKINYYKKRIEKIECDLQYYKDLNDYEKQNNL